jgi:pimeloyl-ACP methyl ester carboxylesterase
MAAAAAWGQPAVDSYLTELAREAFRARDAELARLDKAGAERRQQHIRERMLREIGGFPAAKSPLNPRITRSFNRPGYRVDNLIFESRPNFYVTANLYVPTAAKAPFPALAGVAGHSANGKASATYQHVWISLAKRGFLVLAFDPPGQGERSEYFDPAAGMSRTGIGVNEHIQAGIQTLLTGTAFASYEIYDGIRAVDYLLTRPDVDPAKIAVAGNSGGGTQSAYLAVMEPRLAAVVASCYMTSWKQLWFKPGPQDAEQIFPGFLSDGFDFGDFAFAAAPKPFLMTTAIQDFFPIEGARNTYQEIKGFYAKLDAEAKAGYYEYDDTHGWSKPRREAAYRWLEKWLHGKDDPGQEGEVVTEAEQLLYATRTGQLMTSENGETVQSLNARQAVALHATRTAAKGALSTETVTRALALDGLESRPPFHSFDYRKPTAGGKVAAVLSLNAAKADLDEMLASGKAVLNIQFAMSSGNRGESGYTSQYQTASRALLVGRTLTGLWVSDVLKAVEELRRKPEVDASRITLFARGNAAVAALHANFLSRAFSHVVLEAMPLSYLALAEAKFHRGMIDIVVPGVLKWYDLPDLAAFAEPARITLADTRSPSGAVLLIDQVRQSYPKADVRYRPEGWTLRQVYPGIF